jgi:hypothetical protein
MSEPVIALNKLTKSYGKHRGVSKDFGGFTKNPE